MNIKELIGKYEYLNHAYFRRVDTSEVLRDLKQLDEPQKVVVSEAEAKFLETFNLNHRSDVTKALYYISRVGFGYCLTNNDDLELRDLSEEFWDFENRKRLIKAILDGYEVEKEKRYRVKMKGILKANEVLNYKTNEGKWVISSGVESAFYRTKHTRKQLEDAGFGWVFDCEGIEIEEVTE